MNKKSKIVDNKILTKVIDRIQCQLMDLGNITYDIERELSSTTIPGEDASLLDRFFSFLFGMKAPNESLRIILYSRDDASKCVWTKVDMDAVLKLTSKDGAFAEKEFVNPMALRLRRAFEALK